MSGFRGLTTALGNRGQPTDKGDDSLTDFSLTLAVRRVGSTAEGVRGPNQVRTRRCAQHPQKLSFPKLLITTTGPG